MARTTKPLGAELPRLLGKQGVSLRTLAQAIDVNQSYLSRIMGKPGAATTRRASAKVASAVAEYFDLPIDYFPEYREAVVIDAVTENGRLRDRVYDSLKRR